ncbi:hypothetical protein BGZ83_009479, partial [Gryganskiella cystojenkinii]
VLGINGTGGPILSSNIPIIYNMRTNQWVTQFVAENTASSPSPSTAAAIGGSIGAIMVMAAIGTVLFLRRRKSRQHKDLKDDKSEIDLNHFHGPPSQPEYPPPKPPVHHWADANASTDHVRPPPKPLDSSTRAMSNLNSNLQGEIPPSCPPQYETSFQEYDRRGRNPQSSSYAQQVGVIEENQDGYSQMHSLAGGPHSLPPRSDRQPQGSFNGRAPQAHTQRLARQPQQRPQHANSSSSRHDSISTNATNSSFLAPSTTPYLEVVESKADLARRQLELLQVRNALELEELRIQQALKVQRMKEELSR